MIKKAKEWLKSKSSEPQFKTLTLLESSPGSSPPVNFPFIIIKTNKVLLTGAAYILDRDLTSEIKNDNSYIIIHELHDDKIHLSCHIDNPVLSFVCEADDLVVIDQEGGKNPIISFKGKIA